MSLEHIIATEELERRPAREPDFHAENAALHELSNLLSQSPKAALQGLVDQALKLCRADSAGISIEESEGGKEIFRWQAVAGRMTPYLHGTMPRDFSPCGVVVERKSAVLMIDLPRHYEYVQELGMPFDEVLLVPFFQDQRAIGTVWVVSHDSGTKFEKEDRRLLESLAAFTNGVVQSYFRSKALEDSRRELHDFFMQAPVPMVVLEGPDHLFTLANPLYEKFVDRKVVGKTVRQVFDRGEAEYYIPILDEVFRTGNPYVGKELPLQLPDPAGAGTLQSYWIDVGYHSFRDSAGHIKGVMAVIHDVTHQVNARIAQEKSERIVRTERQKLESIFYGSGSAMVLFKGPDLVYEMINEKYQALIPGREVLGKPLLQALPEIANSPFPAMIRKVLDTGIPSVTLEARTPIYNHSTGKTNLRYFDTSFSRINDADGQPNHVIGHATDVTDRVLAHSALEESKAKISQTVSELEKERDLRERFVAALTHDLRTPLTGAKMSAQLLSRNSHDAQKIQGLAARIEGSVDRAENMVRDLLDANRIKAGEGLPLSITECDLNELLYHTLNDLRTMNGDRFLVINPSGEIRGYWDGEAIQRIVENLASNAVKYGKVDAPVTIGLSSAKDYAEISVHNEGDPIPSEDQEHLLFKSYRRSESAINSGQKGWGIGLTLVKGIAEAHHGSVRVESKSGLGTTFFVRVPLDGRAVS